MIDQTAVRTGNSIGFQGAAYIFGEASQLADTTDMQLLAVIADEEEPIPSPRDVPGYLAI